MNEFKSSVNYGCYLDVEQCVLVCMCKPSVTSKFYLKDYEIISLYMFQVCAPRRYASKTIYNRRNFLPVGMCFSAKSPDYEFQPFSPPFQADPSKFVQNECEFTMFIYSATQLIISTFLFTYN